MITPGAGWTLDTDQSASLTTQGESVVYGAEHENVAASGTVVTGNATLSSTENWDAVIATFKGGLGTAPTLPQAPVTQFTTSDASSVSSFTANGLGGMSVGNFMVVVAASDVPGSGGTLAVTDSFGNQFSLVKAGGKTAIFLAPIVTGGSATDVVTLTVNGFAHMLAFTVYEVTLPASVATLSSKQLQATNFNLNVPNDNIVGIKVFITGSQSSAAADVLLTVSWINPPSPAPSYQFQFPTGGGTVSFGGVNSTWGQVLTAALVNASTFGFQVKAQVAATANVTFNISAVKVQIFYLASAPVTSPILTRDLGTFLDNGVAYVWNATIGSLILAPTGTLAEVESVTTELRAANGTQPTVSVLLDEIGGAFEVLPVSVNDPPQLAASTTVLANRFYLSQGVVPPLCRHLQLQLVGGASGTKDELLSLAVRGLLVPEQT